MRSNVLITCGGKWVGLVLHIKHAMEEVAELQDGKLFVADAAALTPAGCFADRQFVVPLVGAPDYVDALLDLCRRDSVRVLLPHLDIDKEVAFPSDRVRAPGHEAARGP